METQTYNYGETPVEVIRERLPNQAMTIWKHAKGSTSALAADFGKDDLLRVIETLADEGMCLNEFGEFTHYRIDGPAARLRIDILAALGIDESGAA